MGEPMTTNNDALVGRDEQLWADVALELGAWRTAEPMSDIAPHVAVIISKVQAARDAEIRELLLSSSMHDAVDEHLHGVVANGWLREVFRAGLDHIGLTESENDDE